MLPSYILKANISLDDKFYIYINKYLTLFVQLNSNFNAFITSGNKLPFAPISRFLTILLFQSIRVFTCGHLRKIWIAAYNGDNDEKNTSSSRNPADDVLAM